MARICPNCGAKDVEPDSSAGPLHGNPTAWKCSKCGYSGPMPEE